MVGLFLLSAAGVVDLSQVSLKPTVLGADVLGGLLLGFGFVVGGYCPGTSVAASSTGRVDGWVYVGGLFGGTWLFGEVAGRLPGFAGFCAEAGRPRMTLADLTHLPYGLLVLAVAIMAVVAFALAEWAEVRFGGKPLAEQLLIGGPLLRMNPSRRLLAMLLLGGLVAALAGSPYRGPNLTLRQGDLAATMLSAGDPVSPVDLADAMIAGTGQYRLIDVRPAEAFATGSLPDAENVPLADIAGWQAPPTDAVLLFAEDPSQSALAWTFLKARGMTSVYTLRGGLDAWRGEVLHPVVSTPPNAEDEKRIARARALGGSPMTGGGGKAPVPLPASPGLTAPPAAPPATAPPAQRKVRHEGC